MSQYQTAEVKVNGNAYRLEATSEKASTWLANQLATRQPATILRNSQVRSDITVRQIN